MKRFLPCGVQRVLLLLGGMILGWAVIILWLTLHGVNIVRHDSGPWHIEIVNTEHTTVYETYEGSGGLHEVLHKFFWHRNELNEE